MYKDSLYVRYLKEKTTKNTIDDCIIFINVLWCLMLAWLFIVIFS